MGKLAITLVLAVLTPLSAQVDRSSNQREAARGTDMFATNEFFAKGGIGIVSENLYIVVKSAKNELVLGAGGRWAGLDAGRPEVVIFFEGRIWSLQAIPDRFDLSKAVVISFESDKVRFFDFHSMSGGYYRRIKD